jgi:hypothetical protein
VNTVIIRGRVTILISTGFQESLLRWFGQKNFRTAGIGIGTGGASKAVVVCAQSIGIEYLMVSSHFKGKYYLSLSLTGRL